MIFLSPSQNLCGFILFNTRNFMYNNSNKSTRNKIEDFYARRAARRVCRYFGNIASDSSCIRTSSASFASIGCRIRGIKDGKELTYYVYNNCSHHAAYLETGAQGVSYTTGVPAMIGAKLFMQGIWKKPGVWNVEEFNPDPFMKELNEQGLPWHELFNIDLEL